MTISESQNAKNIDPKAREIAKDLARRSGMTLGEWLTQMIVEGDTSLAGGGTGQDQSRQQQQHQYPQSHVEDSEELAPQPPASTSLFNRQPGESYYWRKPDNPRAAYAEPNYSDRYYAQAGRTEGAATYEDDLGRITRALERMSGRIEAAEQRSNLAVTGIDQSVMALMARLESTERNQTSMSAKIEGDLGAIRSTQTQVAERLKRMEEEGERGGRNFDALRSLEGALSKLATHLYESEAESKNSIQAIEQSLNQLSGRVDERVSGLIARLEEGLKDRAADGESDTVRAALADITARLERAEASTSGGAESLHSILDNITARLERTEETTNTALRALEERQLATSSAEVDGVVSRITERLEKAEEATNAALRALEGSISGLEERIRTAEAKSGDENALLDFEGRFEKLSADLNTMVAAARSDLVRKIEETAAASDFGKVDAALTTLNHHIEEAEARSAGAIDRLADEVARIAGAVDKRMSQVEGQSATAIETISTEVSKIADAIDGKFRASETKNIEAIERLGAEFARISDRLTERLVSAERRSSVALDQVGEEVGKISERLTQRYERAAADLAERLRASEQRTQSIIEESQSRFDSRIDQKFSEADRRALETIAPVNRSMAELAARLDALDGRTTTMTAARALETPYYEPPVAKPMSIRKTQGRYELPVTSAFMADVTSEASAPTVDVPAADAVTEASDTVTPFVPMAFKSEAPVSDSGFDTVAETLSEAEDLDVAEVTADVFHSALDEAQAESLEPGMVDLIPTPQEEHTNGPLPIGATAGRDFLAAARQAMRVVGTDREPAKADKASKNKKEQKKTKAPVGALDNGHAEAMRVSASMTTHMDAPVRSAAFDNLPPMPKKNSAKNGRTARMIVGSGLAVAAVGAVSSIGLSGSLDNALKNIGIELPQPVKVAAKSVTASIEAAKPAGAESVAEADVLTITPATPGALPKATADAGAATTTLASTTDGTASQVDPVAQYQSGLKLIASGDAKKGTSLVKAAAESGLTEAQYKLATLYEAGKGVPESMSEAFRWNERAAQGGNRKAMHNMGLYYYYGDGVTQSYEKAAQWFRQAAERGSADSQFNLGLLYEEGYGVKADPAEAYKWFSVAAKSGDAQARKKAEEMAAKLPPEALQGAVSAAEGFKPQPVEARANGKF